MCMESWEKKYIGLNAHALQYASSTSILVIYHYKKPEFSEKQLHSENTQ